MNFNKLNSDLYQLSSQHRFSKDPNAFDKGYMKVSEWLADMCFYYEKKRKAQEVADEAEFLSLIEKHREKILELKDSEYRRGLLKALSEV